MKTNILSIMMVLLVGLSSFSFTSLLEEGKESATIQWVGKKVTGEHSGTVDFKDLNWKFDANGALVAANFTVDMTSIAVTDLEGDMKGKLEGHLSSADFFNVEEHPTASFTTTEVKSLGKGAYEITGDLVIKGISEPITFNAQVDNDGHMKHATANVEVDRAKYDIRYGSGSFFEGLGDKMIYDEFTLRIDIKKH
jgi:polyisoprenoid-binding protein YceI